MAGEIEARGLSGFAKVPLHGWGQHKAQFAIVG